MNSILTIIPANAKKTYLSKLALQLLISEKWVYHLVSMYHCTLFPGTSNMLGAFQTENSIKNAPTSTALTRSCIEAIACIPQIITYVVLVMGHKGVHRYA